MKAFKGKTYTAPVEKDRKELGKYQEKVTQKYHTSKAKISTKLNEGISKSKHAPRKKIYGKGKDKWTFYNYFFLIIILIFISLLLLAIYSAIAKKGEKEDL